MFDFEISKRNFLIAGIAGATSAMTGCGGGNDKSEKKELDLLLDTAVKNQDVPFAVAVVTDKNGLIWEGSAGSASPTQKAGPETVFRLFSQTKGIGSLAAMILVDRKKLSLDSDVTPYLPDSFKQVRVLDRFDANGNPVYRAPNNTLTLRHLLTHTSGLAYRSWNNKEAQWEAATGKGNNLDGTLEGFNRPLMFDPGTDWTYGTGIDWTGFIIENVDGRKINQFVQEEILDPLEMSRTVFEPDSVKTNLAAAKRRGPDGTFTDIEISSPSRPQAYGMGQALYGTAPDYTKFLRLILNDGMVGTQRILSSDSVQIMKTNQIGSLSVPVLKSGSPTSSDVNLFPGTRKTHSIGFIRNEVDIPEMRRAGSLTWAGVLNSHYWIDPKTGIAAVLMTQALPFVDPRFMSTYAAFEKAVYRELT